ncbi:hypothetical protein ACJIZ3_025238 [Penstemon smallii]|uniref:USP domain-containing protein n=1 Tax=Penstemon smallii TaxID=265156 RepID=A0ABD3TU88_9LAMI
MATLMNFRGTARRDTDLEAAETSSFHRNIEFHAARKQLNGFGDSENGFKLVNLNPSASESDKAGNKFESSELLENGLDSEISFSITFRRIKHVGCALQSNGRILEPKDLVSNLRCISRNFRNSRQEDAHEYMVSLLESMHKCCLPSGVPSESPSAYDKSLVHKIFGGRLRSQVKCMQCSFCSNKFEPFLDLSLEIEKADSVYKALAHFTAKEQLDGGAKQYQCHQCNQKVEALKQLTVYKAPHVLAIHLKRFCPYIRDQKINKSIIFGPTLDLKPFVTGPYDRDLKYTLYGVLVHAGWSTHSGHYYCFVRTSSGMWYSLDDNQVVQVSEKLVLEQKAYMLFYVRDRSDFSAKKPVDVGLRETMVVNATENATNSKFNPEIRENIQNGSTEKKLDNNFSVTSSEKDVPTVNAPKETPLEKIHFQNVNSAINLDCSTLNPEPSMVMNATKNATNSKVNPEIREKNPNCFIDVPTVNEPKETPLEKIPLQNVNSTINLDCSTLKKDCESEPLAVVQPTKDLMEDFSSATLNSVGQQEDVQSKLLSDPLTTTKCLSCGIAKRKRPQLKLKMKLFKCQVTGMPLSSNLIFSFAFCLREKKHKQIKNHSLQKKRPYLKNFSRRNELQSNLSPSASGKLLPLPTDPCTQFQREMVKCDSGIKDISGTGIKPSDEFRERVGPSGNMLSSEKKAHELRQSGMMSILTRGLEDTTLARWDEIDVSPSRKTKHRGEENAQIGYVGDEWDEEYDRGKRKKIRLGNIKFGGHNLFQAIAPRKDAKRKGEKKLIRSGSENLPFRI